MLRRATLILACSGLVISGLSQAQNTNLAKPTNTVQKNIVFVHGAHFKASGWQQVQSYLKYSNIASVAVDLPGRHTDIDPKSITLPVAAKALCEVLVAKPQPVVLVVHSQGGAVAHAALKECPQVVVSDLVYVTAVAPLDGAKPFALLSKKDEESYFKGVTYSDGWLRVTDKQAFVNTFTNSTSQQVRDEVLNNAVDEPAVTGDGEVNITLKDLNNIKTHYIFALNDEIISIESQRAIANSINPASLYILNSGHLPMLSQPKELSEAIKSAVRM
ncbi:alpha/beta hydrolase [Pseudoalteromonas fenneropenaei]|uniref:Alpha/beta hydrolase n=1 Tax=Pseudoalteromonas fenneropenaei TaxID=1737459 RepID=A0ABV7CJF3_9GAMM